MGSVLYLNRDLQRKEPPPPPDSPPSLLRPGYNCYAVAKARRVALIVDAEAYFRAFYEAALRARRSITILGWDFNSQTRLHFDPVPAGGPPALLGEFLNYLVRRRRFLHVNVLNWDYPMVFGADREFPPLYGFGWQPARRVHLRYDDTHPVAGSQHQKIVLIDDALAFEGTGLGERPVAPVHSGAGDQNAACSKALQIALDMVPCEAGSVYVRSPVCACALKAV